MNKLWILTKYFLKNAIDEYLGNNNKNKGLLTIVSIICIFLFISIPFAMMINSSYDDFSSINQEPMLISTILFIYMVISLFFGIYTVLNIFYFSNDIEEILPLPVKSEEVVFGKFTTVLINMMFYSTILIIPLITYGVLSHVGVVYYFYLLLTIVVSPILPIVISAAICIIIMRISNFSKHKDIFKILSGCIAFLVILLINSISQDSAGKNSLMLMTKNKDSLVSKMSGIFITNKYLSIALADSSSFNGFKNIIIAIFFSVIILLLFYILIGKFYLKSVIGLSESYSSNKSIYEYRNEGKFDKDFEKPQIVALIIRDLKINVRTPRLFLNSIAMILYMPLTFSVVFLSGFNETIFNKILSNEKWQAKVLVMIFIIVSVFVAPSGTAITALSREGKDFFVSKFIPVSYKTQLDSKIISTLCINEIAALIMVLMLIFMKVKPILILLGAIISIVTILLLSIIGIYIDFRMPKLDWDDEGAILKNNYMPMAILAIMLLIGMIFYKIAEIINAYSIIFILIVLMCIALSIILYKKLILLAYKVYNEN